MVIIKELEHSFKMNNQKVAIIHDFLLYQGGAEKILEQLLIIYPNADIYTLFHDKRKVPVEISDRVKHVSILNKLPFISKYYKYTLFLWPYMIEKYDLSLYDLVISSSAAYSYGVLTKSHTKHIALIYTPPRYSNDLFFKYFNIKRTNPIKLGIINIIMPFLRIWEYISSSRPSHIISISNLVSKRIFKYFRRQPDILIYPPVDTTYARESKEKKSYYLSISPFKENKQGELIVQTAIKYNLPLKIIGKSDIPKSIKKMIKKYPNIEIQNTYITEEEKWKYISQSKALIMGGIEEFGIVALEAISCGIPVISSIESGSAEILNENVGVLYSSFTPESIFEAILKVEDGYKKNKWKYPYMNKYVQKYSNEAFRTSISSFINDVI